MHLFEQSLDVWNGSEFSETFINDFEETWPWCDQGWSSSEISKFERFRLYDCDVTPLSKPERQLLVPYSTKANAFCELGRKKIGKNETCSPQKAFAFVEYGTRSCLSGSDSGVEAFLVSFLLQEGPVV